MNPYGSSPRPWEPPIPPGPPPMQWSDPFEYENVRRDRDGPASAADLYRFTRAVWVVVGIQLVFNVIIALVLISMMSALTP